MKKVASLGPEQALDLMQRLRQEAIPAQIKTTVLESGLEISDIFVPEESFESACTLAEAWDDVHGEEARRRLKRRCPGCRSYNLEFLEHDKLGHIGKCRDCGREFELK